jgi:hypothetical protein
MLGGLGQESMDVSLLVQMDNSALLIYVDLSFKYGCPSMNGIEVPAKYHICSIKLS